MLPAAARMVRQSFDAYRTADRAEIEALLHPDFTFTSPYDDHIDRAAYFERCWPLAGTFVYQELIQVSVVDDVVVVLYDGESKTGVRFRNMERVAFEDGLIRAVEVFFGRPSA